MTAEYEDFLAHYGIKGQKWGLRRFQNEDGSLTQEGLTRYQRTSEAQKLDGTFDKEARAYKSTRNNHTVRNGLAKVLGSVAVTASAGIGLGLLSRGDTKAGAATLVGAGIVAAMLPRKSRQNR